MKEIVSNVQPSVPMLFPYEPGEYWKSLRQIIKEEVGAFHKKIPDATATNSTDQPNKPLYKMAEVCKIFQVTKPTIYDWVKLGKLKPFKIRSRVFFHRRDVERLFHPGLAD